MHSSACSITTIKSNLPVYIHITERFLAELENGLSPGQVFRCRFFNRSLILIGNSFGLRKISNIAFLK